MGGYGLANEIQMPIRKREATSHESFGQPPIDHSPSHRNPSRSQAVVQQCNSPFRTFEVFVIARHLPLVLMLPLVVNSVVKPSAIFAQSSQVELARRHYEAKRYAEAQQILRPLGKSDAEAAFMLGQIALVQNDAPTAVNWLEQSVKMNPRSSEYYDWLGKAYGTQAQKAGTLKQPFLAKKTKAAWDKAIELDPNNLEAKEDMIEYYLQAPGFLGGSKEKARAMAIEVRNRNGYRGAFVVAQVCGSLKDKVCVERELKAVVTQYPDSAAANSLLASHYANETQYDKAFAVIDARLKSKPDDGNALYALGRTASMSGQNLDRGEQALKAYIAAPVASGPPVANAHYRLGMIAEKKGDRALAKAEYQQALKLNPKLDDARKALAALK